MDAPGEGSGRVFLNSRYAILKPLPEMTEYFGLVKAIWLNAYITYMKSFVLYY